MIKVKKIDRVEEKEAVLKEWLRKLLGRVPEEVEEKIEEMFNHVVIKEEDVKRLEEELINTNIPDYLKNVRNYAVAKAIFENPDCILLVEGDIRLPDKCVVKKVGDKTIVFKKDRYAFIETKSRVEMNYVAKVDNIYIATSGTVMNGKEIKLNFPFIRIGNLIIAESRYLKKRKGGRKNEAKRVS